MPSLNAMRGAIVGCLIGGTSIGGPAFAQDAPSSGGDTAQSGAVAAPSASSGAATSETTTTPPAAPVVAPAPTLYPAPGDVAPYQEPAPSPNAPPNVLPGPTLSGYSDPLADAAAVPAGGALAQQSALPPMSPITPASALPLVASGLRAFNVWAIATVVYDTNVLRGQPGFN
ncbi:MAG: hypothetical protein JOZ27_05665, partial [Caulobacteraceae bacterium]|nr:hypothetical protein [Caulobacteraceae bacterium]